MSYTPFVYSITFTHPATGEKRWYIGSRYARGCHPSDLWTRYFTSSVAVKKLIAEHGKLSFATKIVKTFQTHVEALSYEEKLIRRANRFGLKLRRKLINGSIPNSKWPVTTGISPPNKGKRYQDYLTPERYKEVKAILSRPKSATSSKKMVATRRDRGSYDGGCFHPRAKEYKLVDPTGKIYELNGNLKSKCKELQLSWQTLYNNKDKGPIQLDRAKYKNISRLTQRFFNTIGWELRSN